ncbi:hypothetical protein [Candidatus Albibeggiatoa sp. nov. NOAA]|uniref:RCC1 domain-containing protein n=1 Tax=Candidatus Albibeggiatoa sp. nov. NOAA TaxID=3162724 RepID=UPI00330151B8|nr:hypothetical protein [Thiotrichaceae bacterium]
MRLLQSLHCILGCLLVCNLAAAEPQIAITGQYTNTVMVLQEDGTVIGWGDEFNGQLLRKKAQQQQPIANVNLPVSLDIQDIDRFLPITGTYSTIFAQKTDGSIWYWGADVPSFTASIFPRYNKRHIPQMADEFPQGRLKKLDFSTNTGFFLLENNQLWISSYNPAFYPNIIDESSKQANGLVLLSENVADFSASTEHVLIVKTDGSLWSVGTNDRGQLGIGNKVAYNTLQKVNLTDVKQVVALSGLRYVFQYYSSEQYSLALKHDGTVWAWGSSLYLGTGATEINEQLTPVQVDIEDVKALSASFKHTLALKNDGTVWAWGNNRYGQLGSGTVKDADNDNQMRAFVTTPVQVQIDNVSTVGAGWDYSIAIKNDGSIWTWGNNSNGMLGDGTIVSRDTPQSIVKNTLYMPEGFLGDEIDEFVALLNTHNQAVNAVCSIYYEDGTGFSFPLTLPPEQRSSFSLKEKGVAFYRPFAMVIEPEKRITATFIHYGAGNIALGANFTPVTSEKWATAQGFFNHEDKIRNYLVGFNPNDEPVKVNVRITGATEVFPRDIPVTVAAKSRFSIKLQDHLNTQIPEQPIGALVSADKGIVVAMTQYDDFLNEGVLSIAEPSWGHTGGYVSEGWLSESGFEVIHVMNPSHKNTRIYFSNINPNPAGFQNVFANITLKPYQQKTLVLKDYLPINQPLSISVNVNSSIDNTYGDNVVANFNHFDLSGLNGVNFVTHAHTHWEFAEGFKGRDVLEFLLIRRASIYNIDTNIKVRLYYHDGQANAEIDLFIPGHENKIALLLHDDDRVRSNPDQGILYGITIDADQPIVPYFTHYDFNFGGAFALSGTGWNP